MRIFVAVAVLCGLGGGVARAGDDALIVVLQGRYAAVKAAFAAKDEAALRAVVAADFAGVDMTGHEVDGKQMFDEVMALKPDPHRTSTTTVQAVVRSSSRATA